MYNRSSYGTYPYGMPLPARKALDSKFSTSPTRTTASVSPGSPPRKVVTDFAAFGAPANASVFGTKVANTPFSLAGGKAAFGGIRHGRGSVFDAEEEEEEEEGGRQRIELTEGSISLDQVSVYHVVSRLTLISCRPDELPCKVRGDLPDPKLPLACNILRFHFSVLYPLDHNICQHSLILHSLFFSLFYPQRPRSPL